MFQTRIKEPVLKNILKELQTAQRELNGIDKDFGPAFAADYSEAQSLGRGGIKRVTLIDHRTARLKKIKKLQSKVLAELEQEIRLLELSIREA